MAIPALELKIEVNDTQADKDVDQFARDTWKKLDSVRLIELRANTDNLDLKLFKLRSELSKIKKEWKEWVLDENAFKRVSNEIRKTSSELTEAKRRIQNLKNTGDENLSRLQVKFNSVNKSISEVREEMIRMWKSQSQIEKFDKKVSNLKEKFDSWKISVKQYANEVKKLDWNFNTIWKSIKTALLSNIAKIWVSIWALVSSRQIAKLSESFTWLTNRLKQVSEWEWLDELRKKIFRAANESRTSVEAYAQSFVRFDLVNRQLWGSQEETLKILDSLSKWLSATGAEATEVSSVMLQLSQAFGSWRLAGDEFRSVSENMPILLDILSERLWVARWELKNMAADGLITSQVLKWALLDANEQLNESFNKTSITISQAFTVATNNLIAKFWELDQQYSITERIVQGIQFLWKAAVIAFDLVAKLFVWLWNALNILKDSFNIASDAISDFTKFVQKNAKIITSILVAAFVTIRRESFKNLIVGTFWAMRKWIIFLLKDLPKLTFQIILQSKAIAVNTAVKIKNAVASITLSKALNILSLSFLRTRGASIALLKSILTMGKRIFIVAGIFTTVAVAIFKNWDALKQKFSGIFQIIAWAGDAAANIVAVGWNGAVSIVAGAVKLILNSATKVVSALNKIPWVDIDTSGLKAAVWNIDWFASWLKITSQDVKWTFAAIWGSAKWLVNDFTGIGWSVDDLWLDMWDLWGIVGDLWDSFEDTGAKWKSAGKAQEDAIEKFSETAKDSYDKIQDAREENNEQIKEEQERIKELKTEYEDLRKEAVDNIRGISNELKTLDSDQDNELAERKLEIDKRILEINKEISDNNKKDSDDQIAIQQKKKTLQKELNILKQKEKEFTDKTKQSTKDSLDLQIQKKNAQIESLKSGKVDNSDLVWEIKDLQNELDVVNENVSQEVIDQVKAYEQLNDSQKILLDNAKERQKIEEELLLQQAIAQGRQFDITTELDDQGNLKAFVKDSEWILQELYDFENIENANKLLLEAEARKNEVLLLQESILQKQNLEQDFINQLQFIESNYTSFIQWEWNKREEAVKDYSKTAIAQIARIKAAAADANISIPSTSSSSSTSGQNVTNNITNNIEVNNATAGAAAASTDTIINNITWGL